MLLLRIWSDRLCNMVVFMCHYYWYYYYYYASDFHRRGHYKMTHGVCPSVCHMPRPNWRTGRPRKPSHTSKAPFSLSASRRVDTCRRAARASTRSVWIFNISLIWRLDTRVTRSVWTGLNSWTYLKIKRSKIKVIRPINAATESVSYLPNEKVYERQTRYTDGEPRLVSPTSAMTFKRSKVKVSCCVWQVLAHKLKSSINTKIDRKIAHHTGNNAHRFKVKRSKVKVTRQINARVAVKTWLMWNRSTDHRGREHTMFATQLVTTTTTTTTDHWLVSSMHALIIAVYWNRFQVNIL